MSSGTAPPAMGTSSAVSSPSVLSAPGGASLERKDISKKMKKQNSLVISSPESKHADICTH